jgi:hypothetical protein
MTRRDLIKHVMLALGLGIGVKAADYRANTTTPEQYLANWYNGQLAGSGGHHPRHIVLGSDLFDQYRGSLQFMTRYGDGTVSRTPPKEPFLFFKNTKVHRGNKCGWWIKRLA